MATVPGGMSDKCPCQVYPDRDGSATSQVGEIEGPEISTTSTDMYRFCLHIEFTDLPSLLWTVWPRGRSVVIMDLNTRIAINGLHFCTNSCRISAHVEELVPEIRHCFDFISGFHLLKRSHTWRSTIGGAPRAPGDPSPSPSPPAAATAAVAADEDAAVAVALDTALGPVVVTPPQRVRKRRQLPPFDGDGGGGAAAGDMAFASAPTGRRRGGNGGRPLRPCRRPIRGWRTGGGDSWRGDWGGEA